MIRGAPQRVHHLGENPEMGERAIKISEKSKCREKHMYKGPGAGNYLQALNIYKLFPGYSKIIRNDLI